MRTECIYSGERTGRGTAAVFVSEGGVRRSLPIAPSLDVWNHSTTGFEWGYLGSGPAQLALALLLDVTGDREAALAHYQTFKREVVARFYRQAWAVTSGEIDEWLRRSAGPSAGLFLKLQGVSNLPTENRASDACNP
jgi:hypothetical protein